MSIATASTPPSCSSLNVSQKPSQAGLAPSCGDEQHARAVEIVDDGEVAMALTKALLVDAQMGDRLGAGGVPARAARRVRGCRESRPSSVPADRRHLVGWLLSATRSRELPNSTVKRLETSAHGSRSTRGPCSGQSLRGGPGMQNRAVLASVEMTPTALGLMIMEPALGAALGTATSALVHRVRGKTWDFAAGPLQLHAFDFPGTLNA